MLTEAKDWLLSRGLVASDIPKAVVVHEAMGLAYLFGLWGVCWWTQPTSTLLSTFNGPTAGNSTAGARPSKMQEALEQAERKLHSWKSWLRVAEPRRLVVSLAESLVVRTATRPVTVPFKLWLTWQVIMLGKTNEDTEP